MTFSMSDGGRCVLAVAEFRKNSEATYGELNRNFCKFRYTRE